MVRSWTKDGQGRDCVAIADWKMTTRFTRLPAVKDWKIKDYKIRRLQDGEHTCRLLSAVPFCTLHFAF